MKIATITCHDVYNYGASLQAYALQEYCKNLGCDYEIINYRSSNYGLRNYFLTVSNNRFKNPFLKIIYILLKLPSRIQGLKRKKNFDKFTKSFLQCSKESFYTNEEIKQSKNIEANLFVAGSDQIWNTILRNGRDPAYYLNFAASKPARKISYAGSFGTNVIYNNAERLIKREFANFDSISVRENSAKNMIENIGYHVDCIVCDPVFLLSKYKWDNFSSNTKGNNDSYIVVYDCEDSESLRTIAQRLKKELCLPIYSLSKSTDKYADKHFSNSGPIEFVDLIKNAKYVIANSFHALAFSVIFQRDFIIVNRRGENNNIRMYDFLDYINLTNRLINNVDEYVYSEIDWEFVSKRMYSLIGLSKEYLLNQISLSAKLCH